MAMEQADLTSNKKICTHCKGDPKPLDHFPKNSRSRDGHGSWCKACARLATQAWSRTEHARSLRYPAVAAYRDTPRGKLVARRAKLKYKLALARTEERKQLLMNKLEQVEFDIEGLRVEPRPRLDLG